MFWHFTVWINCSSNLKHFTNSWPSASNFKYFSRSLEQFFLTVGQNNFGNKITFLHCRCYYCDLEVKIAQLFFLLFFQVWKKPCFEEMINAYRKLFFRNVVHLTPCTVLQGPHKTSKVLTMGCKYKESVKTTFHTGHALGIWICGCSVL